MQIGRETQSASPQARSFEAQTSHPAGQTAVWRSTVAVQVAVDVVAECCCAQDLSVGWEPRDDQIPGTARRVGGTAMLGPEVVERVRSFSRREGRSNAFTISVG